MVAIHKEIHIVEIKLFVKCKYLSDIKVSFTRHYSNISVFLS
ncbi:hypothetical protein MGSAQ_001967 [marine sediment metagenome]|uniref:Uncharacterized protein n=1 Tax=marine sediment metagenome TaxID=412755 RepID=A0A1B6NUX1_9ZZZZ